MSAVGTQITKSQRMTREISQKLGGVAVPSGSGRMTLVSKTEAGRRKLIDVERAKLDAAEQPAPVKLTAKSLALFFAYWDDAGNWSGTPLVGGNVGGSKQQRGNLTQLKKAGLITTSESDGEMWVSFTPAGETFAASQKQPAPVAEQPKAKKAKPAAAPVLTVVQGQIPAGQKLCPTCKLVKDLDQFASDISNKVDGRYYACKACGKIARERQKANREAKATAALQAAATEQPKKARKAKAAKAR